MNSFTQGIIIALQELKKTTKTRKSIMKKILVTDRNPYIRMLISREIACPGCITHIIETPGMLLDEICFGDQPDIIILDPEIISHNHMIFIRKIKRKARDSIIVIHGFIEWAEYFFHEDRLKFIEKNGTSIGNVKKFINSVINM